MPTKAKQSCRLRPRWEDRRYYMVTGGKNWPTIWGELMVAELNKIR